MALTRVLLKKHDNCNINDQFFNGTVEWVLKCIANFDLNKNLKSTRRITRQKSIKRAKIENSPLAVKECIEEENVEMSEEEMVSGEISDQKPDVLWSPPLSPQTFLAKLTPSSTEPPNTSNEYNLMDSDFAEKFTLSQVLRDKSG